MIANLIDSNLFASVSVDSFDTFVSMTSAFGNERDSLILAHEIELKIRPTNNFTAASSFTQP